MRAARPILALCLVSAVAVSLPAMAAKRPAHAAPRPYLKTLYFANEGGPGTGGCNPVYVLDVINSGNPCSHVQAGYGGNGDLFTDTFGSVKKATGFRLRGRAPLTGTVYLATYPLLNDAANPAKTMPGPMGADVTVTINGITVGTVSGSGESTAPNQDVAIPVSLTIPSSLNGVVATSVTVTVKYNEGLGVMGVDYSDANASKLVIPATT